MQKPMDDTPGALSMRSNAKRGAVAIAIANYAKGGAMAIAIANYAKGGAMAIAIANNEKGRMVVAIARTQNVIFDPAGGGNQ